MREKKTRAIFQLIMLCISKRVTHMQNERDAFQRFHQSKFYRETRSGRRILRLFFFCFYGKKLRVVSENLPTSRT